MAVGLLGRKCGMTRIFDADGKTIPVSVVIVDPNYITQVKTIDVDGYSAIQVASGLCNSRHINKPQSGHLAKAGVVPNRKLIEFRIETKDKLKLEQLSVGSALTVTLFKKGDKIDVAGYSKGKGFCGVIKRHNFSSQRASHGNSLSHNAPGSIGQNQTPGRVFKGKKMAGHLGDTKVTVHNLEVIRVDEARNVLLIKGAIPGAKTGYVIVRPAIKVKASQVKLSGGA